MIFNSLYNEELRSLDYKTERLQIRPFSISDKEAVIDLLTNLQVAKTYMLPEFQSREDAVGLFQRLQTLSADPRQYVAGIFLQNRFIGLINNTDISGNVIELGYALLPEYHNQGYATEALKGAIAYLGNCGFTEITAAAFSKNTASFRVMEKAGMRPTGHTETLEYRGQTYTCPYYSYIVSR